MGVDVPLVGDFHYNGHKLLAEHRRLRASALEVPDQSRQRRHRAVARDDNFARMIEVACRWDKPVRIGVNWGSLDQALLARLMDENAARALPWDARERDARGAGRFGDRERAARRAAWARTATRIVPVGQGVERAGPDRRLSRAGRALRLPAASRPDRGRNGQQGDRRVDRRAGGAAAGRHRRHDPRLAHARAQRRSHPRGGRRAGDPADDGPARLRAAGRRLPGVRAHQQHVLPGTRRTRSSAYLRAQMPVVAGDATRASSRCRSR